MAIELERNEIYIGISFKLLKFSDTYEKNEMDNIVSIQKKEAISKY